MLTERTDTIDARPLHGYVLYDALCPLCTDLMAQTQKVLQAGGFRPEPLQSPWVRERLNLPEKVLLAEMRVLTREGRVIGGADAVVYLANKLDAQARPWWAWLLVIASRMPFAMPWLRSAYGWVAARRNCRQGVCAVVRSQTPKKEGIQ